MFTSGNWIDDAEDEFKEFVTAPSMSAIKEQILLHKASIIETLNHRKQSKSTNHELIRKINELKRLNDVLPLEEIEESLIASVKRVSKHWNRRYEGVMKRIKVSTESRSLKEFIDIGEYRTRT